MSPATSSLDSPVILRAPKNSASDEQVRVVAYLVDDGALVAEEQVVAEVEGAKAVSELEAPVAGRFHIAVPVGDTIDIGQAMAVIAPPDMDRDSALAVLEAEETSSPEPEKAAPAPASSAPAPVHHEGGPRFSKAARALMDQPGAPSIAQFAGMALVRERDVRRLLAEGTASTAPASTAPSSTAPSTESAPAPLSEGNGRMVIAGAGPGAWQIISAVQGTPGTVIVGILDDDPAKAGVNILGYPVIGPLSRLEDLAAARMVDSIICSTPTSIAFRRKVGALARSAGIRGARVIHPTAVLDLEVRIGGNTFIGALCYVGAGSVIGPDCFLSSRTTIEHHNEIGAGVTTGPSVATSGMVTVGAETRFGAGVMVESNIAIGEGAVIASGLAVTMDVPAKTVVKTGAAAKNRLAPSPSA